MYNSKIFIDNSFKKAFHSCIIRLYENYFCTLKGENMNIVILDGYTTNPGDLSWESLNDFGKVTVYGSSAREEIVERAADADVVIMCRVPMDAKILNALPKLKLITTLAIGYNTIDLETAAKNGVTVCNVPSYCLESVSQMVFALLLEVSCSTSKFNNKVKSGNWSEGVKMNYTTNPLFELAGKTFGIFGFGSIAVKTAAIAEAFGMKVIYYSRTKKQGFPNYEYVDFDTLLTQSDVLSLHCPLTRETEGIIGKNQLAKMKSTAYLINTARGAVTDEAALAEALNNGIIAGAGIDVMVNEPPQSSHPLLTAKNCVITPHISWATKEARTRLIASTYDNIKNYLNNTNPNKVN